MEVMHSDNPTATYYVGQAVTGRFVICSDSPKEVQNVYVKIKGCSDVKWEERRYVGNRTVVYHYRNHETYFKNKVFFIGQPEASGKTMLPAGEYNHPFHINLPLNLPSTFDGKVGKVRYSVEGVIGVPWKFDKQCLALFTVLSPLYLHLFPESQLPVHLSQDQTFTGCCCVSQGNIVMNVSLPRSGLLPNEEVPVTIGIDNKSGLDVHNVVCKLRKTLNFHATTKTKTKHSDVGELRFASVSKRSSQTWTQLMTIPPMPPYNLTHCKIIDLDWSLIIEAHTPTLHYNVCLEIPLTIGTESPTCIQYNNTAPEYSQYANTPTEYSQYNNTPTEYSQYNNTAPEYSQYNNAAYEKKE